MTRRSVNFVQTTRKNWFGCWCFFLSRFVELCCSVAVSHFSNNKYSPFLINFCVLVLGFGQLFPLNLNALNVQKRKTFAKEMRRTKRKKEITKKEIKPTSRKNKEYFSNDLPREKRWKRKQNQKKGKVFFLSWYYKNGKYVSHSRSLTFVQRK